MLTEFTIKEGGTEAAALVEKKEVLLDMNFAKYLQSLCSVWSQLNYQEIHLIFPQNSPQIGTIITSKLLKLSQYSFVSQLFKDWYFL